MMMDDGHVTPEAIRDLVNDAKALPYRPDDDHNVEPAEIERMGGPTVKTQATWRSTNRYAWAATTVHVGRSIRVHRRTYRAWLLLRSSLHQLAA